MQRFFAITTLALVMGCQGDTSVEQAEDVAPAAAPVEAASTDEDRAILVPGSGSYSRPITTDVAEAQAFFDQGLRLAWGFYFPESIASYQEAARLDPNHPMPHWGAAHAMGPNPNSRYANMPDDPKGEGKKAIDRAFERIEHANSTERALIEALAVLYDKEAIPDDAERDRAYLGAMRSLNDANPEDADIGALYAAAFMSIRKWDYWHRSGEAKGETLAVAAALERVLEKTPGHPGANHLYIHLMEASMEPQRALGAADRLEATMPIAGHVVHMPAHIYVRVGQFQKAIDWNVRSQAADEKFAAIWGDRPLPNIGTYPLSHKMHAPHAIDFIRYAATVQGNYDVAIEAAERSALLVGDNTQRGQKRIAAPWIVHKVFGQWDALFEEEPPAVSTPYLDGMWSFAVGSAYIGTNQLDAALAEVEKLEGIAMADDADSYRVGATPASAILKLAAAGLRGEYLQASGDLEGAIESFEKAVAIEDLNNYTEPPDWSQPMRHYLGAALLAAGRAVDAEAVYRNDLAWNQNNGWSLYGLAKSLRVQARDAEAAEVEAAFADAWQHAGVPLEQSRF